MADINLEYLNDRYLAFVLPMELRRLVGQGVRSWFGAGNEEEREHFRENYDERFPASMPDLAAQLKSAIRKFTSLVACWDTNGSSQEKLRDCSKALTSAIDGFVKTLKAGWYDERHRCYMKIANYYREYDQIPRRLRSWDLLGTHHLDHDDNGLKGRNRIIIKNRSGDVIDDLQTKKRPAAPIISVIKTMGWYNAERLAISHATADMMDCLVAPHRQLFELGCLLADVNWGNAWYSPTIDSESRRSITMSLNNCLDPLVRQLWYLIPNKVSTRIRRLQTQDDTRSAISLVNDICQLCHDWLYRSKYGWFDGAYERVLLAYDLSRLGHFSEPQVVAITTRLGAVFKKYGETLEPIGSLTRLEQLNKQYPMRGKHLQFGLKANQVGDPTSSTLRPIWTRISVNEQEDGKYLLSLDGRPCGKVDRPAGTLVKLLIAAEDGKVIAKQVADLLGLKGRKRRLDEISKGMPRQILQCIQSGGRGGTRLVDPKAN